MRRAAFTVYFMFVSISVLYANPCEGLLEASVILSAEGAKDPFAEDSSRNALGMTEVLITYLSRLLDETLIGDVHLVRFAEGLERGEVVNPISEVEAADFRLSVQRSGLEYLIQSGGFYPDVLLTWVREKLSQKGVLRQQREVVHRKTENSMYPIEFVPIQSGRFMMGEKGEKVRVILTNSFEMAIFPVTQWQWSMVMEENPAYFRDGAESVELKMGGKKIRMQPNHPVERVSWGVAQAFIKKLNDLSTIDAPLIYQIIPDHTPGKVYRLPTEAQWEYAVRAGTNTLYSFGNDGVQLKEFAWFVENAHKMTHAVGLKRPNPWGLYDMHGNVWEWVQDRFRRKLQGGKNPKGPKRSREYSFCVRRGASFMYYAYPCQSDSRSGCDPDKCSSDTGFRLVRTTE